MIRGGWHKLLSGKKAAAPRAPATFQGQTPAGRRPGPSSWRSSGRLRPAPEGNLGLPTRRLTSGARSSPSSWGARLKPDTKHFLSSPASQLSSFLMSCDACFSFHALISVYCTPGRTPFALQVPVFTKQPAPLGIETVTQRGEAVARVLPTPSSKTIGMEKLPRGPVPRS